jgi:hypothetical protein
MWLLLARIRFHFPVPVFETRFAAPRWDFIFGMVLLFSVFPDAPGV